MSYQDQALHNPTFSSHKTIIKSPSATYLYLNMAIIREVRKVCEKYNKRQVVYGYNVY